MIGDSSQHLQEWCQQNSGNSDLIGSFKEFTAKRLNTKDVTTKQAFKELLLQVKDPKTGLGNFDAASLRTLKTVASHLKTGAKNELSAETMRFGLIDKAIAAISGKRLDNRLKKIDIKIVKELKPQLLESSAMYEGKDTQKLKILIEEVLPNLDKAEQKDVLKALVQSPAFEQICTQEGNRGLLRALCPMLDRHGMLYSAFEAVEARQKVGMRAMSDEAKEAIKDYFHNSIEIKKMYPYSKLMASSGYEALVLPKTSSRYEASARTRHFIDGLLAEAAAKMIQRHLLGNVTPKLSEKDQKQAKELEQAIQSRLMLQLHAAGGKAVTVKLPDARFESVTDTSQAKSLLSFASGDDELPAAYRDYEKSIDTLSGIEDFAEASMNEFKKRATAFCLQALTVALDVKGQAIGGSIYNNDYNDAIKAYNSLVVHGQVEKPECESRVLDVNRLCEIPQSAKNLKRLKEKMLDLIKVSDLNPAELAKKIDAMTDEKQKLFLQNELRAAKNEKSLEAMVNMLQKIAKSGDMVIEL